MRVDDRAAWLPEKTEQLTALWASGLSVAKIGRTMGISKNAVVGKVHRLRLAARPSPIVRPAEGVAGAAAPARAVGERAALSRSALALPAGAPVASVTGSGVIGGATLAALGVRLRALETRMPAEPYAAARAAAAAPVVVRRAEAALCCWPIGEPRTREFRYCDAAGVVPGSAYCAEHLALSRDSKRVGDAAAEAARAARAGRRAAAYARWVGRVVRGPDAPW